MDWSTGIPFLFEEKDFSIPKSFRPVLGPSQHRMQWVPVALSTGVMRLGPETVYWPQSSADIKISGTVSSLFHVSSWCGAYLSRGTKIYFINWGHTPMSLVGLEHAISVYTPRALSSAIAMSYRKALKIIYAVSLLAAVINILNDAVKIHCTSHSFVLSYCQASELNNQSGRRTLIPH
jgi:hypothetical protein